MEIKFSISVFLNFHQARIIKKPTVYSLYQKKKRMNEQKITTLRKPCLYIFSKMSQNIKQKTSYWFPNLFILFFSIKINFVCWVWNEILVYILCKNSIIFRRHKWLGIVYSVEMPNLANLWYFLRSLISYDADVEIFPIQF